VKFFFFVSRKPKELFQVSDIAHRTVWLTNTFVLIIYTRISVCSLRSLSFPWCLICFPLFPVFPVVLHWSSLFPVVSRCFPLFLVGSSCFPLFQLILVSEKNFGQQNFLVCKIIWSAKFLVSKIFWSAKFLKNFVSNFRDVFSKKFRLQF